MLDRPVLLESLKNNTGLICLRDLSFTFLMHVVLLLVMHYKALVLMLMLNLFVATLTYPTLLPE